MVLIFYRPGRINCYYYMSYLYSFSTNIQNNVPDLNLTNMLICKAQFPRENLLITTLSNNKNNSLNYSFIYLRNFKNVISKLIAYHSQQRGMVTENFRKSIYEIRVNNVSRFVLSQ